MRGNSSFILSLLIALFVTHCASSDSVIRVSKEVPKSPSFVVVSESLYRIPDREKDMTDRVEAIILGYGIKVLPAMYKPKEVTVEKAVEGKTTEQVKDTSSSTQVADGIKGEIKVTERFLQYEGSTADFIVVVSYQGKDHRIKIYKLKPELELVASLNIDRFTDLNELIYNSLTTLGIPVKR